MYGTHDRRKSILPSFRHLIIGWVVALCAIATESKAASSYVIIVTVDGLRSSIFSELSDAQLPALTRLRKEGVSTLNARTDHDWTFTNPNHVSMFTARRVETAQGHKYTYVGAPPTGESLHTVAGFYLTSIWDVAHDHGLRTGLYNAKPVQLNVIDASYNATSGAPDLIGADNGRDKIDVFVATESTDTLFGSFLTAMKTQPYNLSWFHFAAPDKTGHSFGWNSASYRDAVRAVDTSLGSLLTTISTNATLRGRTTIIVTTDHGGTGSVHADHTLAANYTIPFFVWGAEVEKPGDLYFINRPFRKDPGTARVDYAVPAAAQPIRNIESGNLALKLLGLPAIADPGAFVNQAQDLRVALPPFYATIQKENRGGVRLTWPALGPEYVYTVQMKTGLGAEWVNAPGIWPHPATFWRHYPPGKSGFFRVLVQAAPAPAALAKPGATAQTVTPDFPNPSPKKTRRRYSGELLDDGVTGQPLPLPKR